MACEQFQARFLQEGCGKTTPAADPAGLARAKYFASR
jgi:hypothetical protein